MEQIENYLQILSDSLDRKITVLTELLEWTKRQQDIARAGEFDGDAFEESITKKGNLVDELTRLDDGFELLYNRVKEQLEAERDSHKQEIRALQTKIRMIMDQSASIEAMEQRNKLLIEDRFRNLRKEAKQSAKSRDMASNYYKSMNRISEDPVFMDTKK